MPNTCVFDTLLRVQPLLNSNDLISHRLHLDREVPGITNASRSYL